MITENKQTMTLNYLPNLNLDDVIDRHIKLASRREVVNYDEVSCYESVELKFGPSNAIPRRKPLYPRYKFILHTIIERCKNDKDGVAFLPNSVFHGIIGRQFATIIDNLERMEVISVGFYVKGRNSRPIILRDWNIQTIETDDKEIVGFANRISERQTSVEQKLSSYNIKKKRLEEAEKTEFIKLYNQSLAGLRFPGIEDAQKFVEANIDANTHKFHYCMARIAAFNNLEPKVTSIDEGRRIYHYLTNFPKMLRKFLNIKYQLDVHNSHPLQFNQFLVEKYNIKEIDILYYINNIKFIEGYNTHKEATLLCNKLKRTKEGKALRDVPTDVLVYIVTTSRGVFWDVLASSAKMSRDDIKQTMFREVFYSRSLTTRNKPYAKLFAEYFPNVWSVIREKRREFKDKNLAIEMMKVESKMMREILSRLFDKGYKVISIHDAVIVLDDEANKGFNVRLAERMMREVYRAHSFFPTIDVEVFESS